MSALSHTKALYSVEEAAKFLSVSPVSVRRRIKDGSLPSVNIGGRRLIAAGTIDALAAGQVTA